MTLIAFGINHKTAPVSLREQVAFTADSLVAALVSLKDRKRAREAVIVSTCNRTEIYALPHDGDEQSTAEELRTWLAEFHSLSDTSLESHSYTYFGDEAVQHMMRVASGLDSLVLGEPQILGQVKQAFNDAKHSGAVGNGLERLFQYTFSVAKKVRTETDIGNNAVSVAYAAVQLAKHIFAKLEQQTVLLVGAGETIELVARHLQEQGVQRILVANRTLARAEELADKLAARPLTLSQLPSHLHEADIVISSTASQLPLIGKGMVEQALKQRKNRPIFMVDLAVPRDIEAEVSDLDNAYLYSVDDLQEIVEQNVAHREVAAQAAEKLVVEQSRAYEAWLQSRNSIDLVRSYRQRGELQREVLLTAAQQQIEDGKAPDVVLQELAHKLTNYFMHAPTKALNQAIERKDEELKRTLVDAFELEPPRSGLSKK
ncbi:glutamyl-tRNA reductase [Alteromonas oceanisediminis]|uniref:glutamyl-tRNA reductase n=1 Tax=Alteromonas oceanisediminis TaxID=2836180 RepID=UPI001BDA0315|nr:glutamyl-tRNA reductase [Alteromonas oceanisediminis]MBT0587324.1 glutamyl-tRNA reductase [Alteromonas oceanisediminis]